MKPLVSVVMPVRNAGTYLEPAVQSILGQTFSDLELILVDDHSTDGAIDQIVRSDPRLVLAKNPGEGVSSAFNAGFALARGKLIARMDADDIALPTRIEQQVRYLADCPEVAICGACVEIFDDQGIAGGNQRYQEWLNSCRTPEVIHRELYIESPIPNPTAMFRRESLIRLGGYADPVWPEDYDLYLRANAMGMRMGKPEQVLLRWREHETRLTRSDERYDLKRFQAAKAHYLSKDQLAGKGPVIIWGAGPSGRLMHDLLVKEGTKVKGFLEIHPRRIGGTKRDLPVWALDAIDRMPGCFTLVAVGSPGVRPEIRRFMQAHSQIEGEDYLFVA